MTDISDYSIYGEEIEIHRWVTKMHRQERYAQIERNDRKSNRNTKKCADKENCKIRKNAQIKQNLSIACVEHKQTHY